MAQKEGFRSASYDPVPPIAEELTSEAWLMCFDEFQVRYEGMADLVFGNVYGDRGFALPSIL
jgi:predicted ATPase